MRDAEDKARDIFNWVGNACWDFAEGSLYMDGDRKGPQDIENLADNIYEDVDWLGDMIGDRLYDAAGGDDKKMIEIARELRDMGHDPMKMACDNFIERHSK